MDRYERIDNYGLDTTNMTKEECKDDLLQSYQTPGHPIAFSGERNIQRYYRGKLSASDIRDVLSQIESYTLHKQYRRPQRNPSYAHFKRYQWQMDLVDVQHLAQYNDNTSYLLTCIDCHTRYAFVRLLTSKHGDMVLNAFRSILDEAKSKPITLLVDRGTEFSNHRFQSFCKANNILYITPDTSVHGAYIERFNRTLQTIIYKYMTENETNRYIDRQNADGRITQLMPLFLASYNNRIHRMIGVTPYQAETQPELHNDIQKRLNEYQEKVKRKQPIYRIGDIVRIAKMKGKFSRGYNETSSQEMFKIHKVKTNMRIPLYVLSNYRGDEILKGSFYAEELVKVTGEVFRIENVIKRRKFRGKKQMLVKWKGFDDSYNSWIDDDDVQRRFTT